MSGTIWEEAERKVIIEKACGQPVVRCNRNRKALDRTDVFYFTTSLLHFFTTQRLLHTSYSMSPLAVTPIGLLLATCYFLLAACY